MMRVVLALLLAASATGAVAQGAGAPQNVNDCTLLTDPTELRHCIERFEGARPEPGRAAPAPGPDFGEETAGPRTAPAKPGRDHGAAPRRDATTARPKTPRAGRGAQIWIEQVDPSAGAGAKRAKRPRAKVKKRR